MKSTMDAAEGSEELIFLPMRMEHYGEAARLWANTPGIGLSSADREDAIRSFLARNGGTCFVALQAGRVVGTILGGNDGRRGYLYHLAVEAEHRRRGTGRRLVALCVQGFEEAGIDKCHLFVFKNNRDAVNYYAGLGWQARDDLEVFSAETTWRP